MEPYKPEFRAALKAAHPGLTDATIDRLEALTTQRVMAHADRNRALDNEIDELLRLQMPHFHEVVRAQAAKARNAPRTTPQVSLRFKPSRSDEDR